MRRGDVVAVALPGDVGKPRPALIVQSDLFNATHPTFTLLPLTAAWTTRRCSVWGAALAVWVGLA